MEDVVKIYWPMAVAPLSLADGGWAAICRFLGLC